MPRQQDHRRSRVRASSPRQWSCIPSNSRSWKAIFTARLEVEVSGQRGQEPVAGARSHRALSLGQQPGKLFGRPWSQQSWRELDCPRGSGGAASLLSAAEVPPAADDPWTHPFFRGQTRSQGGGDRDPTPSRASKVIRRRSDTIPEHCQICKHRGLALASSS